MATHWVKLRSGIIVQGKDERFRQTPQKTGFSQIGDMALDVEKLYAKYSIQIQPLSSLAILLNASKELKTKWESGRKTLITADLVIRAINFHRIATVLLQLDGSDKAAFFLDKLTKGNLDITKREPSIAKNFFWELELWNRMRQLGLKAEFNEPDIYWNDHGKVLGIACKKMYSDKHTQRVLSKAVWQIKGATQYGIVAFNLDDLVVPADKIFHAIDEKHVLDRLATENQEFLRKHQRHFEKYFHTNRMAGVIVSTSCLTKLDTLYIASQWTVWTHP